jgi:radical SAM family uncharacterized protein
MMKQAYSMNIQETLRLGLRLCSGVVSNLVGVKTPLFCGHKLTYNCNLKCKMCPFWKRSAQDLSLEHEKIILKKIYNAGVCGIAFEGGEPLLRKDLAEILQYARSLPMQTSLITNGTLLEAKIDEITPYINGGIFVSIDGIGKTHDEIRGVSGCFKKAIDGITAASQRMSITINTTIMAQNIHEIEDLVKLAKELGVKISVAVAHDYGSAQVFAPSSQELAEVAGRLVLLKKMGYPLINSISYLQVMGKKKNWSCKPWSTINVSPEGSLVLPCYVRKEYATSVSTFETSIKSAIADFDWKEIRNCQVCTLHCYVEPSLVLSYDFGTLRNWALPS